MSAASTVFILLLILAIRPISAAQFDDAVEILTASGFVSMALTLEVAPAALSSPSLTVFAPPDSAFVARGQPPLNLLSFHLSPIHYSPAALASLSAGDRIPTLLRNHSGLFVTTDDPAAKFSVNGVAVNVSSPIFDDGSTVVYPSAGFFDPNFRLDQKMSNLSCSPAASSEGDLDSFLAAADALRSRGYSAAASFLAAQLFPVSNRSAVTLFAPTDDDIRRASGVEFAGFLEEMARHAVPCRLTWSELAWKGEATKVPTFAAEFPIVVTSEFGEFVAINGVPIAQPNLYFGESLIVHGLASAGFSSSPSPPITTASAPQSGARVRARAEDVSVRYSDLVGDDVDDEMMGE